MAKYDNLFITDMNVVADDMVNEGEAGGEKLPPNLSEPYGIMRALDVPESTVFGAYSWIAPVDDEVFWVHEHIHDDFDEILVWMGNDPQNPEDLGGDLYMTIDGERHVVNTTGAVYIPKGTYHCPLGFEKVGRHFTFIAITLSPDYRSHEREGADAASRPDRPTLLTVRDHRDPQAAAGAHDALFTTRLWDSSASFTAEGKSSGYQDEPSNLGASLGLVRPTEVPGAQVHMGYCWINPSDEAATWVHPHVHGDNDEVLLWMGNDPENPKDLGAELVMTVDGEEHVVTTTGSVFIPRGTVHCPLGWNRVDRPFRFISLFLGPEYEAVTL